MMRPSGAICGVTSSFRLALRKVSEVAPLPAVEWRPGALVVELDPLELMVLRHAGAAAEPLEDALAELRRRHHDDDFWAAAVPAATSAAEAVPALPGALEVLRRFQLEGGFYATTQAPLDSLRHWARPALQALLQAQVWSADVATQGLWLPWELQGRPGRLRQPPQGSALLELLGGAEVVLVGHGCEALQEAHRAGRLFAGGAFGLRCLEVPESRHPHRPAAGFEHSLDVLLADVEALHRERPFTVLLANGGAYRLPLAQAIGSRFGVLAVAAASSWWAGLHDQRLGQQQQEQLCAILPRMVVIQLGWRQPPRRAARRGRASASPRAPHLLSLSRPACGTLRSRREPCSCVCRTP
jgi:hypothetical protein